jgi:hypothetical protein
MATNAITPANIPIIAASHGFFFSTHDSTLSSALARIADEPFRDHVFAH